MDTKEKIQFMQEIKKGIIEYLEEQKTINEHALKPYDSDNPMQEADPEIKKMREIEAIKLRHSIHELNNYIAVIKRMVPSLPASAAPKSTKKKS